MSPLHYACDNYDIDIDVVRALLNAPGSPGVNDRTPRAWFAYRCMAFSARIAVRLGSKNKLTAWVAATTGSTALHSAARHCDIELCKFLLEAKADPTLRNAQGLTPLELADRWLRRSRRRENDELEELTVVLTRMDSGLDDMVTLNNPSGRRSLGKTGWVGATSWRRFWPGRLSTEIRENSSASERE